MQTDERTISDAELERLWFLYQMVGAPNNIPLIEFCVSRGVPFYLFDRYANEHIKNKIEPVTITGLPVPQKKRGRPRKIQNSEACDQLAGNSPKMKAKVSAVIQLYSSLCPEIVDAYDLSIMKQAYYMNEKTFYNKDYYLKLILK